MPTGKAKWLERFGTPSLATTAGTLLLVVSAGLVLLTIAQLRIDAVSDASRNVANLAYVLGEQSARAVQAIDISLRDLQDSIRQQNANTPEALAEIVSSERFRQELKAKTARQQQVDVFAVLDAKGHLLDSTRNSPNLGNLLADRDYFTHFKNSDDDNLFISGLARNRRTKAWVIFVSRRLTARDGSFLGIVFGNIPIKHFEDVYAGMDLPQGESFVLAQRDGRVLVRYPALNDRLLETIPANSPWYQAVAQGGGFYESAGFYRGVQRIVAVQPLREFPLVVSAAVSEYAVLATWRRQALSVGLGSLLILAYAMFLIRTTRRQFARLAKSKQEQRTILDTMDQGLMMVDRTGALVHCNQRARRLLNLPDEFVDAQPTFRDVLMYQWDTNGAGRQDGSFEEFCRKRMVVDRPDVREYKRPDGPVIEMRSVPMAGGGFVRTYTDITARKETEARVAYLAHHDDLTRLVNRVSFRERLDTAIEMSRSSRRGVALMYVDLDRFKEVNDTRGHRTGDRVLAEAAERMTANVRSIDTIARLGGDEFAIILPFVDGTDAAADLAKRLIASLSDPYVIDGASSQIGASIGIALFPDDASSADELVLRADRALYDAKEAGKNTFRFHTMLNVKRSASA